MKLKQNISITMENNITPTQRTFLCFAALTAAIVEFGGLSSYSADHVAMVMESYRWHISLAESKANDNGRFKYIAYRLIFK